MTEFTFSPRREQDEVVYPVLVGQSITLTAINAVAAQWGLPFEAIVGGYRFSSAGGEPIPASPSLGVALHPSFNFVVPGAYVIPVTGVLGDGTVDHGEFNFLVQEPIGTLTCVISGAPGFYPAVPGGVARVSLGTPDPTINGIAFSAQVTNPSPLYGTAFGFLQIVNAGRTVTIDGGGVQVCPANGQVLCDTGDPQNPLYQGQVRTLAPGQTGQLEAGDSPGIFTEGGLGQITRVTIEQESFVTNLMVCCTEPGSIFVPVAAVDWRWSIDALRSAGGWSLSGAHASYFVHSPQGLPTWVGMVQVPANLEWGDWRPVC